MERDILPLEGESFDAVVFSEVLEYINPYYVPHTLNEINRILKRDGTLILTTPNITPSLDELNFFWITPIYRYHVRKYTLNEVKETLKFHWFKVTKDFHSQICDITFLRPKNQIELRRLANIEDFADALKFSMRNSHLVNVLRTLFYPLLKLIPQLRILIVVVAEKKKSVRKREY